MENQRDDLIIIFAGAKNKLELFFNSNPGVSSRIGNHVDFVDYNVEELTEITQFLLHNENRYKYDNETLEILIFYIKQLINFPAFANVRTIKIFLNQLLSYQSIRIENTLMTQGKIDYESLVNIKKEDFQYFTKDDFINIIGSKDIQLYNQNSSINSKSLETKSTNLEIKSTNSRPRSPYR